ncbi:MAG: hypothetical protein IT288_15980 [Bdellovibrionales bacterium]|nr:hypothetical protein [Bdellovibrionales bacterium]
MVENPLSEGGRWVNGKTNGLLWNDVRTSGGMAYAADFIGSTSRYNDPIAHLKTSFLSNQYAEATAYRSPGYSNPTDKHEIELLLRFQITANNARGYEVLWAEEGGICIVRWNGPLGDYTQLGGCTPDSGANQAVDGDVLRAEIIGNVVKVYRNGSLILTGPPDSTYSDGQPGIGFWPTAGSKLDAYGWKNFKAGSL